MACKVKSLLEGGCKAAPDRSSLRLTPESAAALPAFVPFAPMVRRTTVRLPAPSAVPKLVVLMALPPPPAVDVAPLAPPLEAALPAAPPPLTDPAPALLPGPSPPPPELPLPELPLPELPLPELPLPELPEPPPELPEPLLELPELLPELP